MARPRASIERKVVNTRIDRKLVDVLKKINEETGIPMNRLIEDALNEKYQKELEGEDNGHR